MASSPKPNHSPDVQAPKSEPVASESICQVCNGVNPVWFASNELWNRIARYPDGREASEMYGFICPNCFIQIGIELGVAPKVWELKEADR